MKRVVTIAGSDTGGGAGIQADLKTIASLGGHGMSVIIALTAQNSVGIQSVYPIPLFFIEAQMDAVFSDMGADAAKTGMLWEAAVVKLVAKKLASFRINRLVVDPVIAATDGTTLLDEEGQAALRRELLPLAALVTPNLPEAAALAGMEVGTVEEMREAARRIRGYGAKAVLVKGGHLEEDPTDILLDEAGFTEFRSERMAVPDVHGTGCVLSAAIATELATGSSLKEAVQRGREVTIASIKAAVTIGKGRRFANPHAYCAAEGERDKVIEALQEAVAALKREGHIGALIPEVSSNLGYAIPFAQAKGDVAAFPGRIMRVRETIATIDAPAFGASQHIASVILTVMRYDPLFRSAMNIKYSPPVLQACKEGGLRVLGFDREKEPQEVRKEEGHSLEWGVEDALSRADEVPDVIYDEGGWGKEPMIRILGRDPGEVVQKVIEINRSIQ
ncbi:MAG: bifunctional hydroxymethylpyrimidine kinase/phosphomethylpyrimidine kinase [Deltaproteobacteria bacterium RBG_13_52_11]|nr:MAG: bifunctional hydroxymethylpyrimidine kinase/phosphomethylpyrimidine kinase [Deltaproteobacteria bacterium RBG_13_52_11]